MKKFPAIVFDLDGTLVDSAGDIMAALNHALRCAERPPIDGETGRRIMSIGLEHMVEIALQQTGGLPEPDETARIKQQAFDYYTEHLLDYTQPYPGTAEMLSGFQAMGLPMGVCTNKLALPANRVLAGVGLDSYFSVVIGRDSTPDMKPHPGPLLASLVALDASPATAIMVGDSSVDVACARAAAVPIVALRHGYSEKPVDTLGADYVIDDFATLPGLVAEILKNINKNRYL